jgi:outer membrane lipoprotein LolB
MPAAHPGVASGRRCASLGLLSIALVSGCAVLTPVETPLHVYTGRFAASVSRDNQREAVSGRFTLTTYRGRTTLDLASPLGNTLARVEARGDGATLVAPQADGTLSTWQGASPEALAESVLGFSLPVSGLADWIAGRAVPGRWSRLIPSTGLAQRIEQDGWVIVIEERFEDTGTPRRLSFEHGADATTETSLRLRLILDPARNSVS